MTEPWSEIEDHGVPEIKEEWSAAPRDPPRRPVERIELPEELTAIEVTCPP